jgi:hypothetical protein
VSCVTFSDRMAVYTGTVTVDPVDAFVSCVMPKHLCLTREWLVFLWRYYSCMIFLMNHFDSGGIFSWQICVNVFKKLWIKSVPV